MMRQINQISNGVNQEKGQIQIIIIVLIIVGLVLFANLPDLSEQGSKTNKKTTKPVFQQETIISPQEEVTPTTSGSDTISPKRSNGQPKGDLPAETRKMNISLETNETAFCRYNTTAGISFDSMSRVFNNTGSTSHSTEVTGLSEGGEYSYYVKCIDEAGNKNTDDFKISFEVKEPEDTTPPVRRNYYPTGEIFSADTTQVMIGISTDEPAYCRYAFTQGKDYSKMPKTLSRNDEKTYHTAKITKYTYYFDCSEDDEDCQSKVTESLQSGKSYDLFIRCKDLEGNKNTGDIMVYFSIE